MKMISSDKDPKRKQEESKSKKLKSKSKSKSKKGGHGAVPNLDFNKYIAHELQFIHTPYCNFSNQYDTIMHY
jgi:hypothetical protein